MSEDRKPEASKAAAEAEALDIRAQMRAARRNITQAAARVLASEEPRSFDTGPETPRRRDS